MKIEVRRERPEDRRAVEELTREAFWNQYAPGCCEHYLAHVLRDCPAFLPELDLVAESEGRIVGNVMAVRGVLHEDSGGRREVVTIGPISVVPDCQRQGVGARLLAEAKRAARGLGYGALLLCGDPAYYGKQGFVPAERFGIRTEDNCYADALQAFELSEGALRGARGRYCEDAAYRVSTEEAEAFDRQFPWKEKRSGTPGQLRFLEVVALRRRAEESRPH